MEVGDKILLVKDAYDLGTLAVDCENGNQSACVEAQSSLKEAAVSAGIELTIGSAILGSKVGTEILKSIRKHGDPDVVKRVDDYAADVAGGKFKGASGTLDNPPTHLRPGEVVSGKKLENELGLEIRPLDNQREGILLTRTV